MQRPKIATVFGILNIAFAAMSFFGAIATIIMLRLGQAHGSQSVEMLRQSPILVKWTMFTMPLSFLSAIVLLTAGIGLLAVKNWARILSIVYAIYTIILGAIGMVLTVMFLLMPMLERAQQQDSGPQMGAAIGGIIGGVIGGLIGMAYPVILLIFMTRRTFVDQLRAADLLRQQPQVYPPAS